MLSSFPSKASFLPMPAPCVIRTRPRLEKLLERPQVIRQTFRPHG